MTQSWARAIYEGDSLGRHAGGIVYRSAYNGGISLALWHSDTPLRVIEDRWLGQPAVWDRLIIGLLPRRIGAYHVEPDRCPRCHGDPTGTPS